MGAARTPPTHASQTSTPTQGDWTLHTPLAPHDGHLSQDESDDGVV